MKSYIKGRIVFHGFIDKDELLREVTKDFYKAIDKLYEDNEIDITEDFPSQGKTRLSSR